MLVSSKPARNLVPGDVIGAADHGRIVTEVRQGQHWPEGPGTFVRWFRRNSDGTPLPTETSFYDIAAVVCVDVSV